MQDLQDRLDLVAKCMPFLSHASGISQAQLFKLPVGKVFDLLAEHGTALLVRTAQLKKEGKQIENELCLAEAVAIVPLSLTFTPSVREKVAHRHGLK